MPTWSEILVELQATVGPNGAPDLDGIRRKYIRQLTELTGRHCIVYYTAFLTRADAGQLTAITLDDMGGLMEVCRDIRGPIDIVLHSPGGDPSAAASLVRYLWKKYDDIRIFVPLAAMSAAALMCLAANRIVMGKHSQLGPIDPQLNGLPAGAILQDFERAQSDASRDPNLINAWVPVLGQIRPGLLTLSQEAIALSKRLATQWLSERMLRGHPGAEINGIADFFSDFKNHGLHNMGIDRDEARRQHLVIEDLEDDQQLQDAVLSVHHACIHSFTGPAVKLIENDLGRAWVRLLASPQHAQP
jgi:hypothetical protein